MTKLPKQSTEFPGFYEIPGFRRYVVSRDGIVIDKETREIRHCGKNPAGYWNFFLYKDDGNRTTVGKHRLIGIVFIPEERDISTLVINHKNGIKEDCRPCNLEWVTYKENCEHAGATGLSTKCVPIEVRDSDTGEILEFPSFIECARTFGVSKDAIAYRVRIGERRVFPERKQYRRKSSLPWYVPNSVEIAIRKNRDSSGLLVRYVFYDMVKEYRSARAFSLDSGLGPATISTWLSFKDQPILPGLLQLKWAYDETPWREVDDPIAEFNRKSAFSKIVQMTEESTGMRFYFLSALSCAKYLGIKPTALDYRLKSHGKTVFSDGMRYEYYVSSPAGQQWSDGILLN